MEYINKTHEQILEDFKIFAKNISDSKEKSLEFLVNLGINTPDGKLTKNYSDPNKIPQRF